MIRILMAALLTVCAGTALAQAAVTAGNGTVAIGISTGEQQQADAFCLRQTGSHLLAIKRKPHGDRAVECAAAPGRAYTREDIERTGATSTADALRRLDPSIH